MNSAGSSMLLALVAVAVLQTPASARVKVEDSINVDAKPESVWQALLQYQKEEKTFHKKAVMGENDSVKIKEEFARVPVVGSAYINYVEVNHADANRIDYKLVESKVLTVFEGAWSVEPNKDGTGSTLKLTTEIDSWVPAPFKNSILRNSTKKGMEKRLAFVKEHAELLK